MGSVGRYSPCCPILKVRKGFFGGLARSYYLGPLRAPVKRFYITNLDVGWRIDPTGEFLPYTMKGKGGTKTVLNRRGSRAAESGRGPLNQALTYWIYFLRTGQQLNEVFHPEEITVSTTKDVLVEIKIMSPLAGTPHPLADSGFGYSQVLPILVTTLLADIGETVIVEQPELHLNPALQVRLAEFFVAMARSGKQVRSRLTANTLSTPFVSSQRKTRAVS